MRFPPCVVFRLAVRNVMSPGGNRLRELLGVTGRHSCTGISPYQLRLIFQLETSPSERDHGTYQVRDASSIDHSYSTAVTFITTVTVVRRRHRMPDAFYVVIWAAPHDEQDLPHIFAIATLSWAAVTLKLTFPACATREMPRYCGMCSALTVASF